MGYISWFALWCNCFAGAVQSANEKYHRWLYERYEETHTNLLSLLGHQGKFFVVLYTEYFSSHNANSTDFVDYFRFFTHLKACDVLSLPDLAY